MSIFGRKKNGNNKILIIYTIVSFVLIFFMPLNILAYILNDIRGYVNDDIVSLIQINNDLIKYIEMNDKLDEKTLAKKILLNNIEEKLLSQIAEKYRIKIEDEELKSIVRNQIQDEMENFPSDNEYKKFLESKGLTLEKRFEMLLEQLNNSEDFKRKIIIEKFINSQIGGNIIVSKEELQKRFNFSIIVAPTQRKAQEVLLKLNAGAKFEELANQYADGRFKIKDGYMGLKDIGENLLAIEFHLLKMKPGDITGFFPLISDNNAEMYGFAILKLNSIADYNKSKILDELSQKEFKTDFSNLTPVNKEIIEGYYKKYLLNKEQRLFSIKVAQLKNDLLKNLWDSAFVKIKD